MATTRMRKRPNGPTVRLQPGFGWLVLLSFALHLSLFLALTGLHLPRRQPPRAPVYYVDLANLPVARPQAGRPDARPTPEQAPPKLAPAPPKPLPPPVKAAPPKTVALKPPAPAKPLSPKPTEKDRKKDEDRVQSALDKLAAKRDQQELAKRLAALAAAKDTRQAPPGIATGQGEQAGVDELTWLKAFFKANWSLSKYQVKRRDLETRVEVRYSAEGTLLDYRILDSSGDQTFDDSVRWAVLKEKQLPFTPGRKIVVEIVFNLKDLLE